MPSSDHIFPVNELALYGDATWILLS